MSQRRRVIVTELAPVDSQGRYRIEYPVAFRSAIGTKMVSVVSIRMYNTLSSQFDISFTLHADFALETDNRYDGFITFADHYFQPVDLSVSNSPQHFYIWFKNLSPDVIDFSSYKFVLTINCYFD